MDVFLLVNEIVGFITGPQKLKPYQKKQFFKRINDILDLNDLYQVKIIRDEFNRRKYKTIGAERSLYLMRDEDTNSVKIGISKEPSKRLKEISRGRGRNTNYPRGVQKKQLNLKLVDQFEGFTAFDEFIIHTYFYIDRLPVGNSQKLTEYFKCSNSLRHYIKKYTKFFGYKKRKKIKTEYIETQRAFLPIPKKMKKQIPHQWNMYISIIPVDTDDLFFINGPYDGQYLKDLPKEDVLKYMDFVEKHSLLKKRTNLTGASKTSNVDKDWKFFTQTLANLSKVNEKIN